jgi:uncharacterized protein (DUF433 family)
MPFLAKAEAPPLHEDSDGALRVGESRVLLELVIRAFQDGATPEAIVQRYSTLELADVYAVVTYYLRNRETVEEYLDQREMETDRTQREIQQTQDLADIRSRLSARRQSRG